MDKEKLRHLLKKIGEEGLLEELTKPESDEVEKPKTETAKMFEEDEHKSGESDDDISSRILKALKKSGKY